MTEQDYNTMPLGELEKMVSGMSIQDMDTSKPAEPKPEEESKPEEQKQEASTETTSDTPAEESKEEEKQETTEPEQSEKKTPESIKKLLHQRSELRQDNDRLRSELAEAQELVKKLRS